MVSVLHRAVRLYRRRGFFELIKAGLVFGYDVFVKSRLPRTTVVYNGVPVRAARITDSLLSRESLDKPQYESGVINSIREHVKSGDDVVIIGGGWGVSTVVAANETGEGGSVLTYEASKKYTEYIRETVTLNGVSDRVEIHHSVVDHVVSMKGLARGAERIMPGELGDCDVLVLDCEGAEQSILNNISIKPRYIIVETHAELGSPKHVVAEALTDLGYRIESKRVADKSIPKLCRKKGLLVLVARRE